MKTNLILLALGMFLMSSCCKNNDKSAPDPGVINIKCNPDPGNGCVSISANIGGSLELDCPYPFANEQANTLTVVINTARNIESAGTNCDATGQLCEVEIKFAPTPVPPPSPAPQVSLKMVTLDCSNLAPGDLIKLVTVDPDLDPNDNRVGGTVVVWEPTPGTSEKINWLNMFALEGTIK